MDTLDTQWCPCQESRFKHYHPELPTSDIPFVNDTDMLEEVKSAWYWSEKVDQPSGFTPGPQMPETRRGTPIIDEHFPEADYVCPCCEQAYAVERTIKPI